MELPAVQVRPGAARVVEGDLARALGDRARRGHPHECAVELAARQRPAARPRPRALPGAAAGSAVPRAGPCRRSCPSQPSGPRSRGCRRRSGRRSRARARTGGRGPGRRRAGTPPRTAFRSSAHSARGSSSTVVSGSWVCRRCSASPRARQECGIREHPDGLRLAGAARARRMRARTGSRRRPVRRPRRTPTTRTPCRGAPRPRRSGRRGRASPCAPARPPSPLRPAPARPPAPTGRRAAAAAASRPRRAPGGPTAETSPGMAQDRLLQAQLELVEVEVEPGCVPDRRQRAGHVASPTWSATIPPAKVRYETSAKPAEPHQVPRARPGRGSGGRSPAGRCRRRRPSVAWPSSGTIRSNQRR